MPKYADLLTRIYKKPGPWVYWNYRPARAPNTVAWERTEAIDRALEKMLADPDHDVRLAVLKRMRAADRCRSRPWAAGSANTPTKNARAAIFAEFRLRSAIEQGIVEPLSKVVPDKKYALATREALNMLIGRLGDYREETMLHLAQLLEDGPLLADALRLVGPWPKSKPVFLAKMESRDPATARRCFRPGPDEGARADRAAAETARRHRAQCSSRGRVLRLDRCVLAADGLLNLTKDAEPTVRKAAFDALTYFPQPRARPPGGGGGRRCGDARGAQLSRTQRRSEQAKAAVVEMARHHPSAEILPLAVSTLWNWTSRVTRTSGCSHATSPSCKAAAAHWFTGTCTGPRRRPNCKRLPTNGRCIRRNRWTDPPGPAGRPRLGWGTEARIAPSSGPHDKQHAWLAFADVAVAEPLPVSSSGAATARSRSGSTASWSSSFGVERLRRGRRSLRGHARQGPIAFIQLGEATDAKRDPEFHLRFRRKIAAANHEQLMQAAAPPKPGNADRGKKLFQDVAKSQCLSATASATRARRSVPTSPASAIASARLPDRIDPRAEPHDRPSYETLQVHLQDGRVLNGVRMAETPDAAHPRRHQGRQARDPRRTSTSPGRWPSARCPTGWSVA